MNPAAHFVIPETFEIFVKDWKKKKGSIKETILH